MEHKAFVVYKQEERPSKWGGTVWELHLADLSNPNINYHTYISRENRNYKNWSQVIENPTKGIVLETSRLRMKHIGQVNADTFFDITVADAELLADQLANIWGCRPTGSSYQDLFKGV